MPPPLLQGTGELICFSEVEGDLLSSLFEMVMLCSASDDGVVFSFITAQDPSVEETGVFFGLSWSTVPGCSVLAIADGDTGATSCLSEVEQDWEALTDSCCPPGERELGRSIGCCTFGSL